MNRYSISINQELGKVPLDLATGVEGERNGYTWRRIPPVGTSNRYIKDLHESHSPIDTLRI